MLVTNESRILFFITEHGSWRCTLWDSVLEQDVFQSILRCKGDRKFGPSKIAGVIHEVQTLV